MDKINQIEGGCHCGNIRYRFYTVCSPQQLAYRVCGCSFCRKHGVVYTSDPQGRLELDYSGATNTYQFASKDVEFVSCASCGIMTHVLCRSDAKLFAALNTNTFDTIPSNRHITTKNFAQESREAAMQRRYQHWVGDVRIRSTP